MLNRQGPVDGDQGRWALHQNSENLGILLPEQTVIQPPSINQMVRFAGVNDLDVIEAFIKLDRRHGYVGRSRQIARLSSTCWIWSLSSRNAEAISDILRSSASSARSW